MSQILLSRIYTFTFIIIFQKTFFLIFIHADEYQKIIKKI